ncbi:RNA polymerase sigma factor [compost metagenome]
MQAETHETEEQQEKELKLIKLEKAIQHLKDEQRICIELFYLKDKSYQEISDELNIPLNTVKSSIQNGKRNLKIWMESHEA